MAPRRRPTATAIRRTGTLPGQSRTYYYPNEQEAALLWYHDHAMGINRLNIYAGLFGLHVIRDAAEERAAAAERENTRSRWCSSIAICASTGS